MEDAKADLAKLAARASSEVALLRDRFASGQNTCAQAKRELRKVANKLALRGLALQGVADRLESQQKALEAAGNASAKQLARLRQSATNAIRKAQAASKRMSMAPHASSALSKAARSARTNNYSYGIVGQWTA